MWGSIWSGPHLIHCALDGGLVVLCGQETKRRKGKLGAAVRCVPWRREDAPVAAKERNQGQREGCLEPPG